MLLNYIFADFFSAASAWVTFKVIAFYFILSNSLPINIDLFVESVVVGIGWVFFYSFWGFYHDIIRKSRLREILNLFVISLIGTFVIVTIFATIIFDINIYKDYLKIIFLYFSVHYFISSTIKFLVMQYTKGLIKSKKIFFNTLIIGASQNAAEIYSEIESINQILGWKFLGYIEVEKNTGVFGEKLIKLGNLSSIEHVIERYNIQQVVVAVESEEHEKIQHILEKLEFYDIKISVIPDLYQIMLGHVSINHVFSIPLIELNRDLLPVWQKNIKRGIDIIASLFVLVGFSPLLLIIALITKITSKGPIFYSQERVGKNGVTFNIYKFRSMYLNSEKDGPALSSKNDNRITTWGRFMRKTRIDELPQFYNVLIADMSLVGPRPERDYYMKQIIQTAPHFKYRLRVKPGITSLAQVKFGYAETVDEMIRRLKYDIFYIKNMSLILDFRIITFTLYTVFKGRGQ